MLVGTAGGSADLPTAGYYVPALTIYKSALMWYYSRGAKIDFAVPAAPAPVHFFDSATSCPYMTAVIFDPREGGLSREYVLELAEDFLPSNSTLPYYSIQASVEIDPATLMPVDPELAAAFGHLRSQKDKWKVEPHLIMDYNLGVLGAPPAIREDLEVVEIPSGGGDHFAEFETFETICAAAFEYDYIPEITAAHLSMGDTNSLELTPVTYVRLMIRRISDGCFVAVGSYMLARTLDIAYISEIAVHPECQKRGYGQHVVNVILSRIAGHGIPRAMLASTPEGIALYLKVGFRTVPDAATMMITSKKPKQVG